MKVWAIHNYPRFRGMIQKVGAHHCMKPFAKPGATTPET